jgi:purine-nucleoside phosphorylase
LSNQKIALAVVLGSGLGEYANGFSRVKVLSDDSNGIHSKSVFISEIKGKQILFFSGRKHFYEGYSVGEITENMQTAADLGTENILITNAAGGLNENFSVSDFMVIESHLNLNQKLVLEKSNFPYSKEFSKRVLKACKELSISIQKGVYCCAAGPAYETRSEIRMLKQFGCDAVGMSTIPESSKANSLGIKVAALSIITNLLNENHLVPPHHDDVILAAAGASEKLFRLIKRLLLELN